MKSLKRNKFVVSCLSFLLALAPVIATDSASTFLWGEPEIPESLRN